MQVSLKLQKRFDNFHLTYLLKVLFLFRLAASVLKVGKRRVWIDPNEVSDIALANSRQAVGKLIKDGLIYARSQHIHSKSRHQRYMAAKAKGRHTGYG